MTIKESSLWKIDNMYIAADCLSTALYIWRNYFKTSKDPSVIVKQEKQILLGESNSNVHYHKVEVLCN